MIVRALYLVLFAAVASCVAVAIARAWRERHLGWWPLLLALISVTRLDLVWNVGQVGFHEQSLGLLGVGFTLSSGVGPILHIGFPAGALLVLRRSRRRRAHGA